MNDLNFYKTTANQTELVLWILLGIVLLIMLIIFITYRYKRFKLFKQFSQEMEQLEFDNDEETTLTHLVKRHALKEPISVLFSIQLFDELAAIEISKVLGSSGSTAAKQNFINLIYEIRKKTYFQELRAGVVENPKLNKSIGNKTFDPDSLENDSPALIESNVL